MLYYNQKGQTLVIVLLVMILALATGLIVSNRVIQGFKRSVKIDSSVRALGVAEALVERILTLNSGTLDDYIANNSCGSACHNGLRWHHRNSPGHSFPLREFNKSA